MKRRGVLAITNVIARRESQGSEYFLGCEHDGARYHVWLNADTKRLQETSGGHILYKNSMADYGQPGYYKTRPLRTDSKFGAELIGEMMEYAKAYNLFAAADKELQDRLDKEKEETLQAVALRRIKEAGPELHKVLLVERDWLDNNIAAVTIAATVCESHGQEHTANVLKALAEEMRGNLAAIRAALPKAHGTSKKSAVEIGELLSKVKESGHHKSGCVSIDGDIFTEDEAGSLYTLGLVERCPDAGSECPHQYHAREGVTEKQLRAALKDANRYVVRTGGFTQRIYDTMKARYVPGLSGPGTTAAAKRMNEEYNQRKASKEGKS